MEFWDIGGSPNYGNGRAVFYNQIHGIVPCLCVMHAPMVGHCVCLRCGTL